VSQSMLSGYLILLITWVRKCHRMIRFQ
jgi:hypothetical protein